MIRKSVPVFPYLTNAQTRLRGDHAPTKSEKRDDDSKKSHRALGPVSGADGTPIKFRRALNRWATGPNKSPRRTPIFSGELASWWNKNRCGFVAIVAGDHRSAIAPKQPNYAHLV